MGGGEKGESQGYWFRAAFGTVSRRWHSCAKGSSFPVPGGQPGNNYQLLHAPETRIAKGIEGRKGTKLYLCSAFKALSGFQITLPGRELAASTRDVTVLDFTANPDRQRSALGWL